MNIMLCHNPYVPIMINALKMQAMRTSWEARTNRGIMKNWSRAVIQLVNQCTGAVVGKEDNSFERHGWK
jgi:hypothetical protein